MNPPVDPIVPATTPTSLEHALRVALQALEARWPRRFDADSQRDHDAIKAVNAALETIEASKRAATEAIEGEGSVVVNRCAVGWRRRCASAWTWRMASPTNWRRRHPLHA
jgi:hypothetical protein